MTQTKIYALAPVLTRHRAALSDAVHTALVDVLDDEAGPRLQRFLALEEESFIFPADRSENYLIVEVQLMAGHPVQQRKRLTRALSDAVAAATSIAAADIEIVLIEAPAANWMRRGQHGDELALAFDVV
jgi:phenylpyruvate tautomerase PptA (4-oxalocrotonate tautomerase family)